MKRAADTQAALFTTKLSKHERINRLPKFHLLIPTYSRYLITRSVFDKIILNILNYFLDFVQQIIYGLR